MWLLAGVWQDDRGNKEPQTTASRRQHTDLQLPQCHIFDTSSYLSTACKIAVHRGKIKKGASVQIKQHCPRSSAHAQQDQDLTSKPDLTTKPQQTWGSLQFSKSQMSFLSLGTKAKIFIFKSGRVRSLWLHTALASRHSKRFSNYSRTNHPPKRSPPLQ